MHYDVIIIGSGAGGSAAAYHLAQTGKRVLVLEKGMPLPRDGSTLDADKVVRRGLFLADEPWLDRQGRITVPEEHFNLGGKTKWYGAALLRFAPHEFEADAAHQCLAWPFGYEELERYYEEAERLLAVHPFPVEPGLRAIVAGLKRRDNGWREQTLGVGLAPDILQHPLEARHFDGFASVRGLKADGEMLLERVSRRGNLELLTGKAVAGLLRHPNDPRRVIGVACEDGTRYEGDVVILAAGALHSPRLLQTYLEASGLAATLPCYRNVGRNYKFHVLTAMIAFSHRRVSDVLCKTLLMLHEALPHSTVQTLGGNLAEEIVRAQFPRGVPGWLADVVAGRAYGLFLQTEDGSHPDNRVLAHANGSGRPGLDYDPGRVPQAVTEHRQLVRTLQRQMLGLGYVTAVKSIPITGTAHACGTLVTGNDPGGSVVDAQGRVHGMENVYVADGSVLPRSSRVNPALTIYAWGLRLASHLGAKGEVHDNASSRPDPVWA
ncbi:MAG TPA: GMC family oxidoreductase [Burkholderiales bacterium]|nr:GMC family oxidoreductase [Burkholderiales bacterium]